MNMKENGIIRALCASLALLTSLSLAACGGKGGEGAATDTLPESRADTQSGDPTPGTEQETVVYEITEDVTPGVVINGSMLALENLPAFPGYSMDRVKTRTEITGLVPDDPSAAEANLTRINEVVAAAEPDTAVIFPQGTYYIAPGAMGGIGIFGKENLALVGQDTKLINTSFDPVVADTSHYTESNFFFPNEAKNVLIQGFELDYLRHTAVDGVITKVTGGYVYFNAYDEFYTGTKLPVTGGERAYAISIFSADGVPGTEQYLDSSTDPRLEKDGDTPGAFRVTGTVGKAGEQISLRMASSSQWAGLVYAAATQNLTVRDVTVRTSPTVLVYASAGCADLWVDRLTAEPAEGSRQLFASNIDGVHLSGLRGRMEMTDCRFIGMGDDALNVHSTLAAIHAADGTTLNVTKGSGHSLDSKYAEPGDTLLFYDADMRQLGKAQTVSFEGKTLVVDALPDGVCEGCTVQNISYAPLTRVLNTTVSRGRARAFLIQTKNALIEGCTIENLRLPAIIISPDFDYWYEAGFADNILIRGNVIRNVCLSSLNSQADGMILISGCHDGNAVPAKGIYGHKNVSVVDNVFGGTRTYAVYARAAENVQVGGNTLEGVRGELRLAK